MKVIVFYKKTNLRFTDEDLAGCSRMKVCMTGQHDRRVNFVAGEVAIQGGRCPLTANLQNK